MTARGIRNNNPGNIRHGARWQGLAHDQSDRSFCVFESMAWGVRALIRVLMTYHNRYGLNTVREIISRWAPPNENDTESYIRSVAIATKHDADEPLHLESDRLLYLDMARAIARHECGHDAEQITDEDWYRGADLAGL